MLSLEQSSQRLFAGLLHNAFPHPLPELRLCGPELLSVAADHKRRLLLLALLLFNLFLANWFRVRFVCAHFDTPQSLHVLP